MELDAQSSRRGIPKGDGGKGGGGGVAHIKYTKSIASLTT